jgi:hypothetical protein
MKKAKAMEDELRNWLIATHGMNAWNDLLRIQAQIRKARKEAIERAKREREQLLMWIMVGVGSLCSLWVVFYVIWKAMGK